MEILFNNPAAKSLISRFVVVLIATFCYGSAMATHIVGGEISYVQTDEDSYTITLKIYRDCGPDNINGTPFDDPAYVGVYEGNSLFQTLNLSLADAVVSTIPADIDNPCLITPPNVCIEEAIYTTTTTLAPTPSGYDLVYVRCCRSPAIINLDIPEDQGMTCSTHITGTAEVDSNSSAIFAALPPALLCANEDFAMDHSATDPDGDSLSYELCWPLLGANSLDPYPVPVGTWSPANVVWAASYSDTYPIESSPAFTIDPVTGWFSGTPTMPGKWVFAICVSEYRDGVLINTVRRDYMVQVLICSQLTVAAIPFIEPCQGMTIQLQNNSVNANTYHWDFGVEGTDADTSNLAEPLFTFPDSGMYTITLTAQPGLLCADVTSIILPVYDPVIADINLLDQWCEEGEMFFDFFPTGDYSELSTFEWSFPAGSTPASSTAEDPAAFSTGTPGPGVVTLVLEDHNCIVEESVNVNVPELPDATINNPEDPCAGLTLDFDATAQNVVSYLWDFGSGTGAGDTSTEQEPEFTYPAYGTYTVTLTVTGENECTDETTLLIDVTPPPQIDLQYTADVPLPCGQDSIVDLRFTGSGATDIFWDFGDNSTSDDFEVSHQYSSTDTYVVQLTAYNDDCNLEETTSFEVYFETVSPNLDLRAPNIITPNDDGDNELLRPFDPLESVKLPLGRDVFDYISDYSLKVYDRWGVLMYETEGTGGWDGSFNGDVAEGVYYFIMKFNAICGTEPETIAGHVEVLRK